MNKLSVLMRMGTGIFFLLLSLPVFAQMTSPGTFPLNEDGSRYVKLTLLTQVWGRSMEYNPGSTQFGYPASQGSDIGIRRFRMTFMGQLTDRVFIYSQFGQNNFNRVSARQANFFVHDAIAEYAVVPGKLSLGAGLTAWSGLARFATPSIGSLLGLDAPLFLQSTNGVTDQFLRKLSIYAKGKVGKLDYRLSVADPMAVQQSAGFNGGISEFSTFSPKPTHKQFNGYVQAQLLDKESNTTPYQAGTYLGKKRVFNIGAGFVYQKNAMWHTASNGADTVETDMAQLAADVYYDAPAGEAGQAISFYGNVTWFNFGPGYIRNLAVMNPTNGVSKAEFLNSGGNGFPAYGTGTSFYGQLGFKLRDNFIGKTTLMPYVSLQHSLYDRLDAPMDFVDAGVNWLLSGHQSKFTLAYQNRPLFLADGTFASRLGAWIAQYQVSLN